MKTLRALLLSTLVPVGVASAATFTVINTNDSGAGSLRQAILDANTNSGLDTIAFNISGSGVHTIMPTTQLPNIMDPVIIDGYTQPGASPNADPVADNALLLIELNGANAGNATGLQFQGGGSTLRGLVVNGFSVTAIILESPDGDVIEGNFIGTDSTGAVAVPNGRGIDILGGNNHTIGGVTPAARNVISGNVFFGVRINILNGILILGNFIGTGSDGSSRLGNGLNGVGFEFTGGSSTGDVVGGRGSGAANVIAYNGASGVYLQPNMTNIPIVGNSIYSNAILGIDLDQNIVPANDPGDADAGANNLQNFPIIQSVTFGASNTTIHGKFNSTASTAFTLDFYANPACSNFPREFVEGQTYLGASPVMTDGSGNATFDATLPIVVAAGSRISATATDPNSNTSEFSQRIIFSVSPSSGPDAGGTPITVSGTDFANPTTMTIGGVAAGSVAFVDDHTLTASTPSFPPGTAQDIVVTTPDGTTGTLVKGWVSDFLDVPSSNGFYPFVTKLVSNGITVGVGGGNYGVNQAVTRAQMSVFLLRGKNGLCYVPPPATGTVFNDVPANSFAAAFIEALAAAGVTGGCGGGNYCPASAVTRAQMAVFLLRTLEGPTYLPPACVTPTFGDVPCSNGFARWIEELVRRSITAGCGGGNYCPANSVTRGQMAVFISVTFGLQ